MEKCEVPIVLAYAMMTFCIACIYYKIQTRHIGTPFKNSLTIAQLKIKIESAKKRKDIFMQGLFLGIVGISVFKPYSNCIN
jgi:hypothetical protein